MVDSTNSTIPSTEASSNTVMPVEPALPNTIMPTEPSTSKSEAEVLPEPVFILKDIGGGTFQVPNTLPWGKEKKVLSIVGSAFKELMPKKDDKDKKQSFDSLQFMSFASEKFDLSDETIKSLDQIALAYATENAVDTKINVEELLQFFAIKAPDIITTLLSVITGKSESDIDEQYAGDSVLAFAVPYVIHAMKRYAGSFMSNF